jgi:excisionase family DNA binding protein
MSAADGDSPWMRSPEAAEYAKRHKQTLAREVKAGRLRAARVGGRGELLFRREWIDQWLEDLATPIVVPAMRRRA